LALHSWEEREKTRITFLARLISAFISTLTVIITFIISTILFNRKVGYLSALLLCLSSNFITLAHFATVDPLANFLYWLACLLTLLVWKKGNIHCYASAAIVAGLAIGVKADRALVLLPLVLSHYLNKESKAKNLLILLFFIPFGFMLANPVTIINPFLFLDGFLRDLFFNALRNTEGGGTSYLKIFLYLKDGIGSPLFYFVLVGTTASVFLLLKQKTYTTFFWLFSTFTPFERNILAHLDYPIEFVAKETLE